MAYSTILDDRVSARDIPSMPDRDRRTVLRAILERLTVDPIGLGKPLTGEFAGMRRLRVGNWRIIYEVDGDNVIIRAIKLRRDSYKKRR